MLRSSASTIIAVIQACEHAGGKQKPAVSRHLANGVRRQPPPEKCEENACAYDPNPPRVTPPEPESDEVPDDEWLDEVSLL